jgi:hypothetical protein
MINFTHILKLEIIGIVTVTTLSLSCTNARKDSQIASIATSQSKPYLPATRYAVANPLHWIQLNNNEAKSVLGEEETLPIDHPTTIKLQSWADHLYDYLEAKDPARFRNSSGEVSLPRPRVRVVTSEKPEAHTTAATACYKVPVIFSKPPADASPPTEDDLILVGNRGVIGLFSKSKVACVDRMTTTVRPQDVIDLLAGSGCRFDFKGDALVVGEDCKLSDKIKTTGANGIVLRSVADIVSLSSGLETVLKQDGSLLYTLLHELAHYFRSHAVLDKGDYQYFYHRDGQSEHLAQPLPASDLVALGAELLKLPHYRTQPIDGQFWHSEIFSYGAYALNTLVIPSCEATDSTCHQACAPWQQLMQNKERMAMLGRFPQAVLNAEARLIYADWETGFSQCLGAINSTHVDMAAAKKVFWRADFPETAASDWRLLDAAASMNKKIFDQSNTQTQLLQRALDAKVGYYTTEEEADNMALNWLVELGFSASDAIDHWWNFAAYFDGTSLQSELNFSRSRCLDLYNAKPRWTENGKPVQVPIGSFSDPHHSVCYRIWNIDQRIQHLGLLN